MLTVGEVVMHPINEFGSDAQKDKYLPQLGKWSSRGPTVNKLTFHSYWGDYWLLCEYPSMMRLLLLLTFML